MILSGDTFSKTIISLALVRFETSQLGATCLLGYLPFHDLSYPKHASWIIFNYKRLMITHIKRVRETYKIKVKPTFGFMHVSQNHNSFLQISCWAIWIVKRKESLSSYDEVSCILIKAFHTRRAALQRYVWVSDWFKCTSEREIVTRQQQIAHSVLSRHQYGILQGMSSWQGAFLCENEIPSKEPKIVV